MEEQTDKLNGFDKIEKKVNIRLHLGLTCMAYMFFGIGMAVQQLGIKAGLGFYPTIIIYGFGFIFWLVIVFTSMQKIKDILFKNNDKT